jgi:hypothetical protein
MSAAVNRQDLVLDGHPGSLVTYSVDQLRPHPAYASSGIAVSAPELSALIGRGDVAFQEPLLITSQRIVVDGYARWELAKQQRRPTLPCMEYNLSEEEALVWLLQKLRPSRGVNGFCRTLMALELEPWLKQRAHSNQKTGGVRKGSSNLTEADQLDVRSELATTAGVSTGNVTKVKQILAKARPELLQALRAGEVSVHRAWCWLVEPERQLDHLDLYRDRRGINQAVNALLSAHRNQASQGQFDPGRLATALAGLDSKQRERLLISEVKVTGEVLLLSPALSQALTQQGKLIHEVA